MAPPIALSAETFARPQTHTVPLVEAVIGRPIDCYEADEGEPAALKASHSHVVLISRNGTL